MIRVIPHDHRLTAFVNQLLDEELSQLAADRKIDVVSLSPAARAAVVEIVTRTLERIEREDRSTTILPVRHCV